MMGGIEDLKPGDVVSPQARVIEVEGRRVRLALSLSTADGAVIEGEAELNVIPVGQCRPGERLERLVERVARLEPLPIAVVCPEEERSLGGALEAAERGLAKVLLVGDRAGIEAAARDLGADLDGLEILQAPDPDAAAALAVSAVREGRVRALMKGHLHTDAFLHPVFDKDRGLRGKRRLSHVFVLDSPEIDHLLLVSDAAINIAPTLIEKVDIVQNAIDLALALGLVLPKVGVLSAVETITPTLPSTLDAALLSKMAERGQITGGTVDGPLAMDNAMDLGAARSKGLVSGVAGRADVLIAPNIEAGNMLAKELIFVGRARSAGVVIGASAPIMLTSRADDAPSRLASVAVAAAYDAWRKTGLSIVPESGL
jgi:phosphate butyryltransferase